MHDSFSFEAIGTHWQIDFASQLSPATQHQILTQLQQRIHQFDQDYSRFRNDSLIMKLNTKAGRWKMPPDFGPLFSLYHQLYPLTTGKFTPLIGQALVDAGYDAQYTFKPHSQLKPPPNFEALQWNSPYLILSQPVLLDFGAAGKGYLIDLVAQVLKDYQITHFTIDAGGDILHTSPTPLRIGLENPQNFDQALGVVTLSPNRSLAGSAGSRRKWGNYHHILDPETLTSPTNILATWVIADSALRADALATCLFFTSPTILQSTFDFEYLMLYPDFSITRSKNFPGELFIKN